VNHAGSRTEICPSVAPNGRFFSLQRNRDISSHPLVIAKTPPSSRFLSSPSFSSRVRRSAPALRETSSAMFPLAGERFFFFHRVKGFFSTSPVSPAPSSSFSLSDARGPVPLVRKAPPLRFLKEGAHGHLLPLSTFSSSSSTSGMHPFFLRDLTPLVPVIGDT